MWELHDATVTAGCTECGSCNMQLCLDALNSQPYLVDNTANDTAYRSRSVRSSVRTVSRPEGAIWYVQCNMVCTAHWFTKRPNAASYSAGLVLQSLPEDRSFRTTLTTAGILVQSRPSPLPSMSLPIHYLLIRNHSTQRYTV
jgi:hypothetical protein